MAMGLSRSAIPPLTCREGFGRVWRFTMLTPSTSTLPLKVSTCNTRPVLPLSRPAMTLTLSSFLILTLILTCGLFCCRGGIRLAMLDDLRRERDDLHVLLLAQLARYRTEHAGPDGLPDIADQHGGIGIEADVGAVLAP